MRTATVLLITLVLGTFMSGCTMMGGGSKTVSATDNQFSPNTLSIKQNTQVTWKNDGSNTHSVTIHKVGDGSATTKKDTDIQKGTSTNFKFEETGTFHVFCKYHSAGSAGQYGTGMVMTVTVS
jgi:plastocyanin